MKASPLISNFNSGEFTPLLQGRSDLAKFASGCQLLENFIPRVQGSITRRAGSYFAAEVKASANRGWLVRFEFSATQAWILEFGDECVRFFTNHGQVLVDSVPAWVTGTAYAIGDLVLQGGVNYYCQTAHTSGTFSTDLSSGYWYALDGEIYEIPSPYAIEDLTNADGTCALKIVQSGDVLYIANQQRTYAPQKLIRFANDDWQFVEYAPVNGPFLELNETAITLQANAQSGSVTITASAALFSASDVGRLVRLEVANQAVEPWETGKSYSINDLARYDGKTYKALTADTSGTSPPIHEFGNAYDGQGGVQWAYQESGYGIVKITGFSSATSVTATVQTDVASGLNLLPASVVSAATARWKLGAWSASTEYPSTVTFWRARLWWGGQQRIWASVPNDFENLAGDFFGQTATDNAIWAQLQAEDVNDILWLAGDVALAIGTPGGEFIGREITTTAALGPANFKIDRHGKRRCRSVQPEAIGESLTFVNRAGRRLFDMQYRLESDRFGATDRAVLAERMTRSGIVAMAWQAEPFSVLWCVLANGKLVGFTYDQEQDVMGWHRQPLGGSGIVESVASIPSPDGLGEDLWLIVRRTINGTTKRYVEWIGRPWEGPDNDGTGGDDQEDAFYVDSGLTYDGAAADNLSGLDHLEGETVQILADGAVHPSLVVSGGEITLNYEAMVVQVGLGFRSRMVTNDIEAGGGFGTSHGKPGKINRCAARFVDTLGGKIGRPAEVLTDASVLETIPTRAAGDSTDAPPSIYSRVVEVQFPGNWGREKRVEVVQDQPLPMTLAALMPRVHANDS